MSIIRGAAPPERPLISEHVQLGMKNKKIVRGKGNVPFYSSAIFSLAVFPGNFFPGLFSTVNFFRYRNLGTYPKFVTSRLFLKNFKNFKKIEKIQIDSKKSINTFEIKKAANPLRLSIVLSHPMNRNWIGTSKAGRHWS